MKPVLIILVSFALAFTASALLDVPFIAKSITRITLVNLLVGTILAIGLLVLFDHVKSLKKK